MVCARLECALVALQPCQQAVNPGVDSSHVPPARWRAHRARHRLACGLWTPLTTRLPPVQMVTRRTGRLLFSNMRVQRWCFDVELVYLAARLGVPTAEECVNWTEIPGSKLRFYSVLSMAAELLMIKLAYSTGAWHVTSEAALPSC